VLLLNIFTFFVKSLLEETLFNSLVHRTAFLYKSYGNFLCPVLYKLYTASSCNIETLPDKCASERTNFCSASVWSSARTDQLNFIHIQRFAGPNTGRLYFHVFSSCRVGSLSARQIATGSLSCCGVLYLWTSLVHLRYFINFSTGI
jgi:hypothetical protein